MDTPTARATPIDRIELPGMLATLCSYENRFGPYHPQTLGLMVEVGFACFLAGDLERGESLLERAVRDVGRFIGRDHDIRLRAIATLRDLFLAQHDFARAAAAQRELLECQIERLGSHHSAALDSRANLAAILMEKGPACL